MPNSLLILFFTVLVLDLIWVTGVKLAAAREFPGSPARQARWTMPARLLFILLVIIDASLGSSGILVRLDGFPPPFGIFMLLNLGVAGAVAFTGFGDLLSRRLSYSALIGFQGFRILAELLIFFAWKEGLAPRQMTFEGFNLDILTGLSALPFAWLLSRAPEPCLKWIQAWNWMGCVLLAIVVFIAVTSLPTPLRLFMNEPSNVWVLGFPYVLLPGILVVAALSGHLLVFRKLAAERTLAQSPDA